MLALLHLVALSAASGQSAPGDGGVAAARGLLTRLLPDHADSFRLEARAPSACKGKTAKCFGYASALPGPKVAVYGTSGVELAMGINHYLKYVGNVSVSWEQTGGNQLSLPPRLPAPPSAVHVERSTELHYYANVCTFSYSFVWYSLADWVREIDWMALQGINLPLAYTGQEAVYQKLYNQFGISNESLSESGLITQRVPEVPQDPLTPPSRPRGASSPGSLKRVKTLLRPPDFCLGDLWLSGSYHPRSEYFGGPACLAWNRGQGLLAWRGVGRWTSRGCPRSRTRRACRRAGSTGSGSCRLAAGRWSR